MIKYGVCKRPLKKLEKGDHFVDNGSMFRIDQVNGNTFYIRELENLSKGHMKTAKTARTSGDLEVIPIEMHDYSLDD